MFSLFYVPCGIVLASLPLTQKVVGSNTISYIFFINCVQFLQNFNSKKAKRKKETNRKASVTVAN